MEQIRPPARGEEGDFVGTGHQQEVSSDRILASESEFDKRIYYARQSETHLWMVTIIHFATDQMIGAFAGESEELPILDADTIAMRPGIICWICEQIWDPRLRHRKCPGEPT